MDDTQTPTKESFAAASLEAQRPLPAPTPGPTANPNLKASDSARTVREGTQQRAHSRGTDEMNVDESDENEAGPGDDAAAASDAESTNADGSKSSKRKRPQRFYCRDYPPCSLSFTRSEHLARHIRKHTGERPFQCHCSRRFSRLDNLRQHAQTVHVNEDIPIDSLAAAGTRFQRQMRNERTPRTSVGRTRSSTAGSIGAPVRGHSKSLSTSSIASVNSVASSVFSPREEVRHRPPPLVMVDPRSRLPMESPYRPGAGASNTDASQYRPLSPTDYSTPTSATFSTGPGSPRWSSGAVVSPPSSHSRAQSMYSSGVRTPGRRLSVPSSSGNPFQSPLSATSHRTILGTSPLLSQSHTGLYPAQNNGGGSILASPTASISSEWSRRDSVSTSTDEAWRRRTWHPSTHDTSVSNSLSSPTPAQKVSASMADSVSLSSRLNRVISSVHYQTAPPVAPAPLSNSTAQQTNLRLPGIESFDPLPLHIRSTSPSRRAPSPMAVDSTEGSAYVSQSLGRRTESLIADDRRMPASSSTNKNPWDMSIHRGLTRLEIASSTSPRDSAAVWVAQGSQTVKAQAEQPLGRPQPDQRPQHPSSVRFQNDVRVIQAPFESTDISTRGPFTRGHHHTVSAPAINSATPRGLKRQGWYHGPLHSTGLAGDRVSNARVDRMVHPNLASGFSSFSARMPQTVHEAQDYDQQEEQQDRRQDQRQDVRLTQYEQRYKYPQENPTVYLPKQQYGVQQQPQAQTPTQQHQQQSPQMQHHPPQQQEQNNANTNSLSRLEALVAVATSEASATAY